MSVTFADVPHLRTDAMSRPSFEAVYREHADFVWRNVRRLGVPPSAVDDAVQKVFLVVHRRLDDLDDEPRIRSWLFQIVRRVARDERRALSTSPTTNAVSVDELESKTRTPDDAYALKSAREQLHAILASMDEEKREVFILADLEGFSAPEIAESTATNVNTVYARLRAARQIVEEAVARLRARAARDTKGGATCNR
jgi:RNA polymerase sigma-70 factor (ECF subfamily)